MKSDSPRRLCSEHELSRAPSVELVQQLGPTINKVNQKIRNVARRKRNGRLSFDIETLPHLVKYARPYTIATQQFQQ